MESSIDIGVVIKNMCLKRVIIGLGSNLGDRAENLSRARQMVANRVGEISRLSSVSETESWGFEAPSFLNQALMVNTLLAPFELLDCLQAIELELGRTEKTHIRDGRPVYSSRTIDLDILDYEGIRLREKRLTIPHPQIPHRDFVKAELRELGVLDEILNKISDNDTR